MAPENRPTFKQMYSTISAYIEHEADYLQLGLNPFVGSFAGPTFKGMEEGEVEDDGEDGEVEVKDDVSC